MPGTDVFSFLLLRQLMGHKEKNKKKKKHCWATCSLRTIGCPPLIWGKVNENISIYTINLLLLYPYVNKVLINKLWLHTQKFHQWPTFGSPSLNCLYISKRILYTFKIPHWLCHICITWKPSTNRARSEKMKNPNSKHEHHKSLWLHLQYELSCNSLFP